MLRYLQLHLCNHFGAWLHEIASTETLFLCFPDYVCACKTARQTTDYGCFWKTKCTLSLEFIMTTPRNMNIVWKIVNCIYAFAFLENKQQEMTVGVS
jgi:hypothetical protein